LSGSSSPSARAYVAEAVATSSFGPAHVAVARNSARLLNAMLVHAAFK
jgi:hypothetical protein